LLLVELNKNAFFTRGLWIITFLFLVVICCDEVNAHVGLYAEGTPMLRKRGGGSSLEIGVRLLKETNVAVAQALIDP